MRRLLLTLTLASCASGCGLLYDFEERPDAGPGVDAATPEAGLFDAGLFDAGLDAAPVDAGSDAAPVDAARVDGGPFDAGPPCRTDSDCEGSVVGTCALEVCRDQVCVPGDADSDGTCVDEDCDDTNPRIGANGFLECEVTAPGVCAHGAIRICSGGVAGPCVGGTPATAGELCNGLDDDCDGAPDELIPTPTGPPGCAAPAAACESGRWVFEEPPPGATPDTCDGIDEDCDGSIDEDCVPAQGECVFVSPSAVPVEPVDPTDPSTPLRSIGAALVWLSSDSARPRQICLLASTSAGLCQHTTFEGATVPAGVGIVGDLFADLSGNVAACAAPDATDIVAEPGQAHSLRFLGSLPDVPLRPTFVRNTTVLAPDLPGAPSRAIEISATAPTRVQEVGVRMRFVSSNASGDGIVLGESAQAVLSDVDVRFPTGVVGSAVVAAPSASLTLNRTRAPSLSSTCDASAAALAGGVDGWAVDAQGATVRGQRAVLCTGSAGGVRVDGGQLVLTRSVLLPHVSQPDIVGVHLRGGADGFLHRVTLAGGLGGVRTRVFVAEGPTTTLRLNETEVRTTASVAAASERTIVECDDATCVLSHCDMSFAGTQASESVGLDCRGQARCIVQDSTLSARSLGNVESVGVLVADEATALIRSSTVTGGCGFDSTIGVDVEGGAVRIERSDVFGAGQCTSGPAVALEVDGGAVDALSSSFSSSQSEDGGTCPGGTRAVYVAGSPPSGVVLRNSVFRGGPCGAAGTIAVELNSSLDAVVAYCGLTERGSMLVDGVEIQDDLGARDNGVVAFRNVYTESPQFTGGPSALSIANSSPFAGAGGPGAPPLDRFGNVSGTPPSMGCCEP